MRMTGLPTICQASARWSGATTRCTRRSALPITGCAIEASRFLVFLSTANEHGGAAMRREDQIVEARKLLAYLKNRTTALADGIYRNPVTDYTCEKQAARERERFFRK